MATKLYVGGLPWATTSDDLKALFEQHGPVTSATIVTDKQTGRSRGFGFVEMGSDEAAQAAVSALNDTDYQGRKLLVQEARPMAERPPRGGGYGSHSY